MRNACRRPHISRIAHLTHGASLNATRYKRSRPAELPGTNDRSRSRRLTIAIYLGGLVGLGLASALLYILGITARYPLAAGLLTPRAGWYRLSDRSLHAG